MHCHPEILQVDIFGSEQIYFNLDCCLADLAFFNTSATTKKKKNRIYFSQKALFLPKLPEDGYNLFSYS